MSSVGTVESIWRFPVKSFQGGAVERTDLGDAGIFADRAMALVEAETGKLLSAKNPKVGDRLLELSARYESEPVPGRPLPPVIATIDGEEVTSSDPAAFAAACSAALGVDVVLSDTAGEMLYESYWPENDGLTLSDITLDLAIPDIGSFADLEPLHLLTTASLGHLATLAPESDIAVGRFRPSMVIDTGDAGGFVENDWEGRRATLGGAAVEFGVTSPRCVMTTRPQPGLPRDKSVLQTLARENRRPFLEFGDFACLGIYARVVEPGPVAVGDGLRFTD